MTQMTLASKVMRIGVIVAVAAAAAAVVACELRMNLRSISGILEALLGLLRDDNPPFLLFGSI